MKIDSRMVGDIHFLDCTGEITLGEESMIVNDWDILKATEQRSATI
jgi:hypothetical protein